MTILVENLPKCGGSTIARWLARELQATLCEGEAGWAYFQAHPEDPGPFVLDVGCFNALARNWLDLEPFLSPEESWSLLNSAEALLVLLDDPFVLAERINTSGFERPILGALLGRFNSLMDACPIPAKGSYILTRLLNEDGTATEEGEKLLTDLRQLRDAKERE